MDALRQLLMRDSVLRPSSTVTRSVWDVLSSQTVRFCLLPPMRLLRLALSAPGSASRSFSSHAWYVSSSRVWSLSMQDSFCCFCCRAKRVPATGQAQDGPRHPSPFHQLSCRDQTAIQPHVHTAVSPSPCSTCLQLNIACACIGRPTARVDSGPALFGQRSLPYPCAS
jgi:hypothetical protein